MRRLCLTLSLLSLLAPAAAQGAARWTIRGGGFGHGIGMSQYGAYGLAQNGRAYDRILAHYYRGTELSQAPSRKVRVLLQASDPYVRIRGATRASGGRKLDPAKTYIARPASGGRISLSGVGRFAGPLRVTRPDGRPLRLMGAAINGISTGLYRGGFELRGGSAGGVTAVNLLSIDQYVRGVVAGEMPSSWHIEALKAQAVAARTYALATRKTGGVFDLYPDTRSQVYRGVAGETSRSDRAVRGTAGRILTYDGAPAITYYMSTSGGRTENVELSFLGSEPKPWLKSVDDPYDDISPRHAWTFRFSNSTLGARLGSRGTLRKVRVIQRGESPRIVRARVYGSRGTRDLTGAQIRARLGLYDSWAFFTRVSSSAALGARAAARLQTIRGSISPAPRSKRLLVEQLRGKRWVRVGRTRTTKAGRYGFTVARGGVYRVRAGSAVGPAVRS